MSKTPRLVRASFEWIVGIQIRRTLHKPAGELKFSKRTDVRLHPYNPVSYLTAAILYLIVYISVGSESIKEVWTNPFKWQESTVFSEKE